MFIVAMSVYVPNICMGSTSTNKQMHAQKSGSCGDTLIGPLGRYVGANDHTLFVCSMAPFWTLHFL